MSGWVAGAVVVGSVISSQAAGDAADTAAQASGRASDASIGEQRRQYDINRADQAPYLAAGTNALGRLQNYITGPYSKPISMADFQQSPDYQWSLDRTMKALGNRYAAQGNRQGGNALRAQAEEAAHFVGLQGENWFNNQLRSRAAQLGPEQSLAGVGQTTAAGLGAYGANMAGNIGNAYMTSAANTGNAAMAAAGIRNSAYGGASNVLGRMYGNKGFSNPFGGSGSGNDNFNIYAPSHAQNLGYALDAYPGE